MSAFDNFVDSEDDSTEFGDDSDDEQNFNAFQKVALTTGKRNLNIAPRYVKGWTSKHAFRELFQNFVDGILESFTLRQCDLKLQHNKDENRRQIKITVPHPNTDELCGYILFKWDIQKMGTLEICNCNARLCDANFQMGGTDKATKAHLAGQHGEGFKLGALTFRRRPYNYSVRVVTSSSYVNFNFNSNKTFVANITQIAPGKINQRDRYFKKNEPNGRRQVLEPKFWEDVCWEIGAPRRSKNPDGSFEQTSKIPLDEFEDWITVTTLIIPPSDMVRTESGDLIIDATMAGKVFLRGLELPNSSATGKQFLYGYNISEGAIGRDRTSLSDANEESRVLSRIWRDAILEKAGIGQEDQLLSKYVGLVDKDEHADVHLAKKHISENVAQLMWTHLRKEADKNEPRGFYYCSEFAKEDVPVITNHLRLKPMQLSRNIWELLHKLKLCRSAQEERKHRFQTLTPLVDPRLDRFGQSLSRLLKACLGADKGTKRRSFTIVDGGNLDIQTYYDAQANLWKLERKLFDISVAHQDEYYCEGHKDSSQHQERKIFWCHHAVVDLYYLMLEDLDKDVLLVDTDTLAASRRRYLRSMVGTLLRRVPQNVLLAKTSRVDELKVTWGSNETQLAAKDCDPNYTLTLHRAEVCLDKEGLGLQLAEPSHACDCPTARVHLHKQEHLFTGLNANSSYFASIRHMNEVAIYAETSNTCSLKPIYGWRGTTSTQYEMTLTINRSIPSDTLNLGDVLGRDWHNGSRKDKVGDILVGIPKDPKSIDESESKVDIALPAKRKKFADGD